MKDRQKAWGMQTTWRGHMTQQNSGHGRPIGQTAKAMK